METVTRGEGIPLLIVTKTSLKVRLLYISIHNQLNKNSGRDKLVTRKEFFCVIGKHFLVPKNLKYLVIKEMIDKNLIKEENHEFKILNTDLNLEEDANKIYQMGGLF